MMCCVVLCDGEKRYTCHHNHIHIHVDHYPSHSHANDGLIAVEERIGSVAVNVAGISLPTHPV